MPKLVHDVGGKVLDCGLDYLRVTAHHSEKALRDVLMHVRERQSASERDGMRRTEVGSEGFVGDSCGGWRWGERGCDGMWLLECSSTGSQQLLEAIKHYKLDARGTRVDCSVTYERSVYDVETPFFLRNLLREADEARGVAKGIRANVEDRPKTGSTLELYSRSSRRFIRHYDKSAQQRHTIKDGVFRAEVEYKREMARAIYKRVLHCVDQRLLSLDIMTAEWRRLGIEPNYDWKGQPIDLGLTPRAPDEVVTAEWLINNAAPAFRRLKDDKLRAQVLEAFFLEAPPQTEIAMTVRERPQMSPADPVPPKSPAQLAAHKAAGARITAAQAAQELARRRMEADRADEDFERLLGM